MQKSVANTPVAMAPSTMATPFAPMSTGSPRTRMNETGEINWERVDKALQYFSNFDVLELAAQIVDKAVAKGPKDIYNEAGPVRYQMAQAKKVIKELTATICKESIEAKEAQVAELKKIAKDKSWALPDYTDGRLSADRRDGAVKDEQLDADVSSDAMALDPPTS